MSETEPLKVVAAILAWLGRSRRNRMIVLAVYVAIGVLCVVAAALGLGAWPHG